MDVQSESDSITGGIRRFGPIIGREGIEARTSLDAVLTEVDKDPKEVSAS